MGKQEVSLGLIDNSSTNNVATQLKIFKIVLVISKERRKTTVLLLSKFTTFESFY